MSLDPARRREQDDVVERVAAANDIVEVISQYVPLKRSGRNFKACCPFHGEKTPSFMVQPEKQLFHCFGCQVGGDVFSFLMRYENLTFPEALKMLADRAHITLPERRFPKDEASSRKEKIYEIYRVAVDFYQNLFLSDAGKTARAYLAKRGITDETVREFKVGWAPDEWRTLYDHLTKKGYSEALLKQSALIQQSAKGNYYDTFRGRVLFPIMNLQHKPIALGGRLLADGEGPKYLNSPENPVFSKRRELFGLNLAKKFIDRDWPNLILVEGYMDFLALYQAGFKNTVATLGTALGEDHMRLMKRFVEEVIVVYDGDKAGEAAALRGLEILLEGGIQVKLVSLPKGFDPDDFVRKEGNEAFRALLKDAQDFFDYKLKVLVSRYPKHDALGLAKISREMLETFRKIKNPLIRSEYFKRLSRELRVDEDSLRAEFKNMTRRAGGPAAGRSVAEAKPVPKPAAVVVPKEELMLLSLMIDDSDFLERAGDEISQEDFRSPVTRDFFAYLLATPLPEKKKPLTTVLGRIQDAACREQLVGTVAFLETVEDKVQVFADCVRTIRKNRTSSRQEELKRLIHEAELGGDAAKALAYTREFQELLKRPKGG